MKPDSTLNSGKSINFNQTHQVLDFAAATTTTTTTKPDSRSLVATFLTISFSFLGKKHQMMTT